MTIEEQIEEAIRRVSYLLVEAKRDVREVQAALTVVVDRDHWLAQAIEDLTSALTWLREVYEP